MNDYPTMEFHAHTINMPEGCFLLTVGDVGLLDLNKILFLNQTLQKLAHAIYRDFFQKQKLKITCTS